MNKNHPNLRVLSIIVLSGVILSGCSLLGDDSPDASSNNCFGIDKSVNGNPDLEAVLIEKESNESILDVNFVQSDLDGLQYGMTGKNGEKVYYGTYELCDLDTGEALDTGDFVYENYTMFDQYSGPESGMESMGNSTDFFYEVEGVRKSEITKPGNYAIYTYSSYGDDVWEVSDVIEFIVSE